MPIITINGKSVDFGTPRENAVVMTKWADDGKTCYFHVVGANKPPIIATTGTWSSENKHEAFQFGVVQKGTNATAIGKDKKTGKSASAAEKWQALERVIVHLNSGATSWNPDRGDRISLDETILSQAMVLARDAKDSRFAQGKSDADIRAKVVGSSPEERLQMRNDERIAPFYDKLVSELNGGNKVENVLAGW